MQWYEILIILAVISFLSFLIGRYIYKRIKHLPTGECSCCGNKKSFSKQMKNIRSELDEERKYCCSCKEEMNSQR